MGCKNNIIISWPEKAYIAHTSRWLYAWHLASNALYFSVAEKSAYSVLQIFTSRAHEYYYYYYCYYYKRTDYSDPVMQMLPEHFMKWSVSEMWVFTAWTAFCGASVLYLNCLYHVPSVLWRCWLGGRKGIWPVKNWVVGCWRGYLSGARCTADLHMAQLMPLPLTVSCFSKIQIGFTFLVPAHLGSPGKGPLNGGVCVYLLCVIRHNLFSYFDTVVWQL